MQKEKNPVAQGVFAEGTVISSVTELATFLGVHKRTIYNRLRRGMPRLITGAFDPGQVIQWCGNHPELAGPTPKLEEKELAGISHKDRLAKVKADRAEMEFAILKGNYTENSLLGPLFVDRARIYRTGMITLEHILPPRIVAALGLPKEREILGAIAIEIHKAVREVINNVLRGMVLPDGKIMEWEAGGDSAPHRENEPGNEPAEPSGKEKGHGGNESEET